MGPWKMMTIDYSGYTQNFDVDHMKKQQKRSGNAVEEETGAYGEPRERLHRTEQVDSRGVSKVLTKLHLFKPSCWKKLVKIKELLNGNKHAQDLMISVGS